MPLYIASGDLQAARLLANLSGRTSFMKETLGPQYTPLPGEQESPYIAAVPPHPSNPLGPLTRPPLSTGSRRPLLHLRAPSAIRVLEPCVRRPGLGSAVWSVCPLLLVSSIVPLPL